MICITLANSKDEPDTNQMSSKVLVTKLYQHNLPIIIIKTGTIFKAMKTAVQRKRHVKKTQL